MGRRGIRFIAILGGRLRAGLTRLNIVAACGEMPCYFPHFLNLISLFCADLLVELNSRASRFVMVVEMTAKDCFFLFIFYLLEPSRI